MASNGPLLEQHGESRPAIEMSREAAEPQTIDNLCRTFAGKLGCTYKSALVENVVHHVPPGMKFYHARSLRIDGRLVRCLA
jgi:hypothetical protein